MDFQSGTFSDEDVPAFRPVLVKKDRAREAGSLCTIRIARDAPRTSNQRAEIRRPAADGRVTIRFRKGVHAGKVVNTSSSGAMIEADIEPLIGEAIELRFGEGGLVPGIARWVRERRIGVEFGVGDILGGDERQDFVFGLSAVDEAENDDEAPSEREPRQAVIRTAMIRAGSRRMPVRLCNLSPGGAMLECEQFLNPGSEVALEMAGGVVVTAKVRWSNGSRAGLSFDAAINPAGLGSLPIPPPTVLKPSYLDGEFDPNSPWAARFDKLTMRELIEDPDA